MIQLVECGKAADSVKHLFDVQHTFPKRPHLSRRG
jgi:hypothetical protein